MNILAIISICASALGLTTMCIKWNVVRKNGAAIVNKFHSEATDFFESFLRMFPYLKEKQKHRFPKFLLYYLANKGFIKLHIASDGNILLLRTGNPDENERAERFIVDSLFETPEDMMYSDEATIGFESVYLHKIKTKFKRDIPNIPIGPDNMDILSNAESLFTFDKEHYKNDKRWAKITSLIILILGTLSTALLASDFEGTATITFMVLVGILYYVSFRCISTLSSFRHGEVRIPRFLSGASKITLNIFKLLKFCVALCVGGFAVLFSIAFMFAFSVEGMPLCTWAMCLSAVAAILIWYNTVHRKRKKEKYYSLTGNDLDEFVSFINNESQDRKKFAKKTPALSGPTMSQNLLEDKSGILPFSKLFFNDALIDEMFSNSPLPQWCEAETPMSFEKVDKLLDNTLL